MSNHTPSFDINWNWDNFCIVHKRSWSTIFPPRSLSTIYQVEVVVFCFALAFFSSIPPLVIVPIRQYSTTLHTPTFVLSNQSLPSTLVRLWNKKAEGGVWNTLLDNRFSKTEHIPLIRQTHYHVVLLHAFLWHTQDSTAKAIQLFSYQGFKAKPNRNRSPLKRFFTHCAFHRPVRQVLVSPSFDSTSENKGGHVLDRGANTSR